VAWLLETVVWGDHTTAVIRLSYASRPHRPRDASDPLRVATRPLSTCESTRPASASLARETHQLHEAD